MHRRTFTIVYLALLTTFAIVVHSVEAMIPLPVAVPIPGVKLGLANVITLLTIIFYGFSGGITVALIRTILGSIFIGNFLGPGFWLSFSGAVLSTTVMWFVYPLTKHKRFSLISVSIMGACAHNLAQVTAASLIMDNFNLMRTYLPFLLIAAVVTGYFIGIAASYLEGVLRRTMRDLNSGGD